LSVARIHSADLTRGTGSGPPTEPPLYPQRPLIIGLSLALGAPGKALSGRFQGKMIAISWLLDREAYAWQADWYRRKIVGQRGDRADQSYRLWYVENGVHGDSIVQDDPATP
jgi:hypothetical protein